VLALPGFGRETLGSMKRMVFFLLLAMCGGGAAPAENPKPQPTTTAQTPPPTTASASASTTSAPPKDVACEALDAERTAETTKLRTITESKDPLSHVQAMNDDIIGAFGKCTKTKSGAAWGIGLRDLKEELHGVTAQLVAIHASATGQKASVVLAGTARTKDRAFQSHELDHVAFDTQSSFDFDGDGEDELIVIGHDQTKDGPRDPMAYIVEFKNGTVEPYPPAKDLPIFRVEDVDRDGRPDFVSYGPYRARISGRCDGSPAQVVGPAMLVHSLPNGSFSMTDDRAVAFAKQHCEKPGFSIARDEEKHVDDDQTFVNVACARLWGMSEAQAVSLVGSSCVAIRGDASCKQSSLTSCVYPTEMMTWARAKPPLLLK
jgi:hypothetical protein